MKHQYVTNITLDVVKEIKKCIDEGRFDYFKVNDLVVGFYTWHYQDKDIFINNVYIKSECWGKVNILKTLKEGMKKYPTKGNYIWENRRRNRIYTIKGER